MYSPISGADIWLPYLVGIGVIIGLLGGFFGVGGGFLSGPLLFLAGLPMHFVVGTDLAYVLVNAIVGARKHYSMGNVDIKLGLILGFGSILGVEVGAQIVEFFKFFIE